MTAQSTRAQAVWRMFDRIAPRYDLLNRLLSFGQDVRWRNKLKNLLPAKHNLRMLDVATGTGDVALTLMRDGRIHNAVGIDMAVQMLAVARSKTMRSDVQFVQGDCMDIPYAPFSFDVATIAFGIRNVVDVDAGLRDLHRVLVPGGRLLVLEFSLPQNALLRAGYLFYFRHILPRIGGVLSGDREAYTYLNQTVEAFPYGEAFVKKLKDAGFAQAGVKTLTFGVASLYWADKGE